MSKVASIHHLNVPLEPVNVQPSPYSARHRNGGVVRFPKSCQRGEPPASEALAKLYQRLNPQIDMGQRTPQTIGEELLDYRNYLEMEVEVNRGSDGWLRAESGALSTGVAIGTGMSILVMVVQSWEDEARRLRGKDISPCRLLFLDEAARLDARSIATLFELCERLDMQLIIAAPENISPEKGTTYKLVRKVFQNSEHVHVVGLRGFAPQPPESLPGTADAS